MSTLSYFRTRLAHAQAATELPASARYDLAASSLDDDALEQSVSMFGGPEYGSSGFGISDVMTEMLSRDPKFVAVGDLRQHQESLVNMGYANGVVPDGNWSPYWASASRLADRDSLQLVRSGQHWGAATTKKFMEFLNYTYAPEAVRGIIGAAKGMVAQLADVATNPVEVAEEGGLLGGAAVGAGAGALAGSILPGAGTLAGAAIGGAIGGVAGFFGDLFDDEEPEEGNLEKFISSLTPFEEISSGDAKRWFNAASLVMTASAFLRGGQLAVQGVRGVLGSGTVTGARAAGGMVLPQVQTVRSAGLRAAFQRAAPGTFDKGITNRLLTAAVNRPVVGSATIGGTIDAFPELLEGDIGGAVGDFARGAAIGAVAGRFVPAGAKAAALKGLEAAPLRAITQSAAGQISNQLFTGVSTASIGARVVGGVGGQTDVIDPRTGQVLEDRPGTPIAEAIEDEQAIDLPGPVEFALGAVLYPNRLLPWAPRDVGRALSALSSNNELLPFAEAARRVTDPVTRQTTFLSLKQGMERAKELMGRASDGSYDETLVGLRATYSYLTKGIDDAAEQAIRGQSFDNQFLREAAKSRERSRLVGTMFREAGKASDQAPEAASLVNLSPTARKMIDAAKSNPMSMRNHIEAFEGRGSTLENFSEHQWASEFLQSRGRSIVGSERIEAFEGALAKQTEALATAQGPVSVSERTAMFESAQAEALKKNRIFVPALRDDPAKGIVGYQTRQHFEMVAGEYQDAATQYKQAYEAALKAPPDSVLHLSRTSAGERLDMVLSDAKRRGMVDDGTFMSLRPTGNEPVVSQRFINELQETAKVRPREVPELSRELSNEGLNRYIALETPENMLFYDQVPKLLEVQGIREYARRRPFFDLIGSLSTKVEDADLGKMRFNSITAEADAVAAELNLPMNGSQITNKIYNELRVRYDPEYALRARGEQLGTSFGVIVKRTDKTGKSSKELFKLDPRDITPDDIVEALDLDSFASIADPYEAAGKIKRALHVGSAFGADVMKSPLHPIQQARALGRAMKVTGLPGFNDFMRTAHLPRLQKMFPEKSYGYLPQNLHRASMALRYSLSPQFDAGRYIEQASFGAMKGAIPPAAAFAPRRFLASGRKFKSPYSAQPVQGEEAVEHAMKFYDEEILGRTVYQNFDELQMRLMHKGILGFSPRQAEAAQAFYLYSKKAAQGINKPDAIDEIRNTIYEIGRYGTGQTPLAKSAHFIMFPYLFQAKQLRAMEDFVYGAPMRSLLIHEGFRRWYGVEGEEGLKETMWKDLKKRAPILNEMGRLNNLSYGIGPGRFFLEGFMDKGEAGKVGQALSAFFVPGGSNQPLHEAIGGTADALKHLFVPVVLFDDEGNRMTATDEIVKSAERLIPAYRDAQRWLDEHESPVFAQLTAITEGSAPYDQYRDYMEVKGQMGVGLDIAAKQAGYSSWDSLRASPNGAAVATAADDIEMQLGQAFPTGAEMAARFTNRSQIVDQALHDIATKEVRTEAEEIILVIGTTREMLKGLAAAKGYTQEEFLRMFTPNIRTIAANYLENPQFMNLYKALFESEMGPLRKVALV